MPREGSMTLPGAYRSNELCINNSVESRFVLDTLKSHSKHELPVAPHAYPIPNL